MEVWLWGLVVCNEGDPLHRSSSVDKKSVADILVFEAFDMLLEI